MDRSLVKAIGIITVFFIVIGIVICSIVLVRSTSSLTKEINEKIVETVEKSANDFSAEFNHMEGLTDSLASHVMTTFDIERYEANHEAYVAEYKAELASMIQSDLSTVKSAHSLYVTFNPELTTGDDEVWYAWVGGEIQEISADFETNVRKFDVPYEEDMEYFFKPQDKDYGVWTGEYYDKDIGEELFSYSRAIYVDDLFIGIAGADINADDMVNEIKNMNLYEGGYAALLDENYDFIIYNDKENKEEAAEITKILKKRLGNDQSSSDSMDYDSTNPAETHDVISGKTNYEYKDTEKIMGYSQMRNGWIFITTQPEKSAYEPLYALRRTMLILDLVLGIAFIVFLVIFTRPFISKTTKLEEENRNKEIMLIYQSRQAKIGEMISNITHQLKQPLNTINLILANLLDSYRYGDLDEKRLEKSVAKVENVVEEMSDTITDFSGFLQPTKDKEYFNVKKSVDGALALMEESIGLHNIKINVLTDEASGVEAFGYYNETVQVILNLLNNARDAVISSDCDEKNIIINITKVDEEGMARISIINKGSSIPEEVIQHIFEPYFTTKEDAGGTGLGLYISKEIIEQRMGGRIEVENGFEGVRSDIFIPVGPQKGDKDSDEDEQ